MQSQTGAQPTTKRTPYRTPKLLRYGQLASLTAGGFDPSFVEGVSSGLISPA